MKILKRLVISLVITMWLFSSEIHAKPASYEVFVDGIACPFCAYGIEKQLDKLGGIREMRTDVASGVIRLTVDGSVTLNEKDVRKAVENAGFSLTGFIAHDVK